MFQSGKNFKNSVSDQLPELKEFLVKVEDHPPMALDEMADVANAEVWQEVDCLACANCCRNMSPRFTLPDMQRLALHFRMSVKMFKEKWLIQNKAGEWMPRTQPCPFLHLTTNKCSVYAIRPVDCAGFPHLTKKKMTEYLHVHKQNIKFCPASFKFVQKLAERFGL